MPFRFGSVNITIGIEISPHRNQGIKFASMIHSVRNASIFCSLQACPHADYSKAYTYGIVPELPITLWKIHFIIILKRAALNSGHLTNNDKDLTISCISRWCNLRTALIWSSKLLCWPNFLFSKILRLFFFEFSVQKNTLAAILFQIYTANQQNSLAVLESRLCTSTSYCQLLSSFIAKEQLTFLGSIILLYNFIQCELIIPIGIF